MLRKVPIRSCGWSGTGTVIVPPSIFLCMMQWLPRWRISLNPSDSRMRQTSRPERTRSLPNRYLDLCNEYLRVQPPVYFRR